MMVGMACASVREQVVADPHYLILGQKLLTFGGETGRMLLP